MMTTLKVKKVRLSDDDLKAIVKRVQSSRSIQWWKDDIKQLLYEVKCLKDEAAERDGLAVDNAKLRAALKQIADGNPAPLGGKWLSDAKMAQIARSILSNVEAAS